VQLISISVTPSAPAIPLGSPQQFTATGSFNNGTTQNVNASVAWSSSAAGVAAIGAGGLASSVTQGNTTITAQSGTVSGSTVLTVGPPVLRSISIAPINGTIPKGQTQQFAATGVFSDASTQI